MSKNKSNFLVFRSYIPWVILGLVIIMWLAAGTQKNSVLANPAAQAAFALATFSFDLTDEGRLYGYDGPDPRPGEPPGPTNRKIIGVVFWSQDSPGCVTIIQFGVPIKICD